MASPRLGYTELSSGQAIPETTVNEMGRYVEQGANRFIFKDRDLSTPPGSPADGDCYLVKATGTGAWSGKDGKIAFYENTAWAFITAKEGMGAYINDEDIQVEFDGSTWNSTKTPAATASQTWTGTSAVVFVTPSSIFSAATPTALVSSATITPDFNTGFNFSLTLAHTATLANPTNSKVGQSGVIAITQDGTGSRTLAYGTNWKFPGGAPVLSTAPGSIDVITYYVSAAGVILCNLTKAYAS
jgi:hypothetical protein